MARKALKELYRAAVAVERMLTPQKVQVPLPQPQPQPQSILGPVAVAGIVILIFSPPTDVEPRAHAAQERAHVKRVAFGFRFSSRVTHGVYALRPVQSACFEQIMVSGRLGLSVIVSES